MTFGFEKKRLCLNAEAHEHQCKRKIENQRSTDGTTAMKLPSAKVTLDSLPGERSKNGG